MCEKCEQTVRKIVINFIKKLPEKQNPNVASSIIHEQQLQQNSTEYIKLNTQGRKTFFFKKIKQKTFLLQSKHWIICTETGVSNKQMKTFTK